MDVSQSRVDPSLLVVDLCFRVYSHTAEYGAVRPFTGAVLLTDEDGEKDAQIGWLKGHLVDTGRPDFMFDADGESGDLVDSPLQHVKLKGMPHGHVAIKLWDGQRFVRDTFDWARPD